MNIPDKVEVYFRNNDGVEVYFDFQPFEEQTRTYPGCDASVTITEVLIDKKNITASLSPAETRELECDVMEQLSELNDNSGYGDFLYDAAREDRYFK